VLKHVLEHVLGRAFIHSQLAADAQDVTALTHIVLYVILTTYSVQQRLVTYLFSAQGTQFPRACPEWSLRLFHWVATLGKLFTHTASPVSQLQETGVQKGVFGA